MIFGKKSVSAQPKVWGFGVSVNKNAVREDTDKFQKDLQIFESFREDFSSLLILEDIELFTKHVPLKEVDKQMTKNLLPKHLIKYLNLMGAIRFLRLHEKRGEQEFSRAAIELFRRVVQGDGELMDDIVDAIENGTFSEDVTKEKSVFYVANRGMTESLRINEGILEGEGDMLEKVKLTRANSKVIENVQSLFKIVMGLEMYTTRL